MKLICIISIVMRDKIVRLSIISNFNSVASKNLQNFIFFSIAKFSKQTTKPA